MFLLPDGQLARQESGKWETGPQMRKVGRINRRKRKKLLKINNVVGILVIN